jgi:hypothetical protein
VEHIPPDCLPGEGAVSIMATSGDLLSIQHVTRCHVLPTRGEAATGSLSGKRGLGFQKCKGGRKMVLTVPRET